MAIKILTFDIDGESALWMHNVQLANPFNHYTKRMAQLQLDKKKKGADKDAILGEMANTEWEGGLYRDRNGAPAIPAHMMRACIREAARASKAGKDIERAVVLTKMDMFTLAYDGPKDVATLMTIPAFRDCRPVGVMNAKIARTRPQFLPPWHLRGAQLAFHADYMAEGDLVAYIERAGMLVGIGDGRTLGMGRFSLVDYKVVNA